jgi:ribosomal protein L15E
VGAPSIQRSLLNGWKTVSLFEGRINKAQKHVWIRWRFRGLTARANRPSFLEAVHNLVLKGHSLSRANMEQVNRGLYPLRECPSARQAGDETGSK